MPLASLTIALACSKTTVRPTYKPSSKTTSARASICITCRTIFRCGTAENFFLLSRKPKYLISKHKLGTQRLPHARKETFDPLVHRLYLRSPMRLKLHDSVSARSKNTRHRLFMRCSSGLGWAVHSIRALDWAAEVFLKTYTEAGGAFLPAHLSFQQAGICLERAKSDVDKQLPGWEERAEMMLNEGLRILDHSPSWEQ